MILINDTCDNIAVSAQYHTVFADPPDNLGLKYDAYNDRVPDEEYAGNLARWIKLFVARAYTTWVSFNARHWVTVARIVSEIPPIVTARLCVQTYTFGQHCQTDLSQCFRPLLRLQWQEAPLFPDAIRVPSARQTVYHDKRADPRGCVPSDVFDFPRITGNHPQRRKWHPTQLREELIERCLKLTTPAGGLVCDPFGGTGTVARVCKAHGFGNVTYEIDRGYCESIAAEMDLHHIDPQTWSN